MTLPLLTLPLRNEILPPRGLVLPLVVLHRCSRCRTVLTAALCYHGITGVVSGFVITVSRELLVALLLRYHGSY
eukprot:612632-Prorocentrum_minimum.AAC.2